MKTWMLIGGGAALIGGIAFLKRRRPTFAEEAGDSVETAIETLAETTEEVVQKTEEVVASIPAPISRTLPSRELLLRYPITNFKPVPITSEQAEAVAPPEEYIASVPKIALPTDISIFNLKGIF